LTDLNAPPRDCLDRFFAGLRQEGRASSIQRWRGYFDRATGRPERIILFGAGQFGSWTLARLRKAGVEPLCFSDNNPARWKTYVDGLEVLPPVQALTSYSDNATVVVTVFNGSSARKQLRQMGFKYVLSAVTLFWKFPDQFMPDFGIDSPELIADNEKPIRQCFELLADEHSRREFCDQLRWRYMLEPEFLVRQEDPEELYFPENLIKPISDEVFVDCGAYDGDCLRSLLHRNRTFKNFYALEPDRDNRHRLGTFLSEQPSALRDRVTVWPYAVSNRNGTATLTGSGDVASRMTPVDITENGQSVECRRLDSLEWSATPTYIKMDIEGEEPNALEGGTGLLTDAAPVLAICLYHRSGHLWEIPIRIHAIQPRYSLFLRRYAEDCWEQVCYAVPKERLIETPNR
jgi:FkbM family methyltransferase